MSIRDELGNQCDCVVNIHMRSLGMPAVPEFTALRNAQAVYGQYGICIRWQSGQSLPDAVDSATQTVTLQNINVGQCVMPQGMTQQQDALFGHGSFQNVGVYDILCYWVQNVATEDGTTLAGCASHPAGRGACIIAAAGSPWTLAHEVGHVLGLNHATGTTRLMSTPTASITANPPELSLLERVTVRASRFCSRC